MASTSCRAAVELARAKLAHFAPDAYRLFAADVTRLDELPDLRAPYDLIIDIGCGHSIDKALNPAYAAGISARLKPGGLFMLYASHPRPESTVGWSPQQVARLFTPALDDGLAAAGRGHRARRGCELVSYA